MSILTKLNNIPKLLFKFIYDADNIVLTSKSIFVLLKSKFNCFCLVIKIKHI